MSDRLNQTQSVVPSVSIIMNCLNGEKYLREAIDSVCGQTYKDWEIIFWDNASTDNSAGIANSYDGRLRYFKSEKTVTLSRARNWALEKARGKYIAFLDCDDKWLSRKLEYQVRILDEQSEAVLVYGNFFKIFPDGKKVTALKGDQPSGEVFEKFLYNYPVGMLTAMVKKGALEDAGTYFDERLKIAEDYDMFMRVVYKKKAAYLKEPVAVYRMHDNRRTLTYKYSYADEYEYVVEKLKQTHPGCAAEYEPAFKYVKGYISYLKAKIAMAKNDPAGARKYLKPYKRASYGLSISYLMTFLPPVVWNKMHDIKNKGFLF